VGTRRAKFSVAAVPYTQDTGYSTVASQVVRNLLLEIPNSWLVVLVLNKLTRALLILNRGRIDN
jgi:hypothetical protein